MYHFYALNRAEFLQHRHKRSNIETTFHMIKSKQVHEIVGFDLLSPADRVFAYDYDSSGKLDHLVLVLYRPGTGSVCSLLSGIRLRA